MERKLDNNDKMLVQLNVAELREVVRSEIEAAKKQELPRLLYNTKEAAKILDVPPTWLGAQARAGKIPVMRKGHYVRFRLEDLEEFAAKSDPEKDHEAR